MFRIVAPSGWQFMDECFGQNAVLRVGCEGILEHEPLGPPLK